jgi:ABC-type multidrug transport system fused ATPase/permease subunit
VEGAKGAPKGATVRELLAFARPWRGVLAVSLVLGVLATAAQLGQPLAVGGITAALTDGRALAGPVALLVAFFVLDAGLSAAQTYLLGRTGEAVVLDLRSRMISRLLRLPVKTYDRQRTGDLVSRVGADTTLLRTALGSSLTSIVAGTLTFVGAVALMVAVDPLLFLVTLLCVTVAAGVVFAVSGRVRRASEEAQRSLGRLSAALERALGAVRTVKISRAEDRETEAITSEARAAYDAGVRVARIEALVQPATAVTVQAAFVLVLGVGAARLASGTLALPELVTFLLLLTYLVAPLATVFFAVTDIQQGLAALTRLGEILGEQPEEPEGEKPAVRVLEHRRGPAVRFEDVSFAYEPGRPVLRGATFEVPEVGLTALVGPSGAGKSTTFALLERFYEPDGGRIFLDGLDVRELPLGELRGRIGYVQQDSPVLAGTLRGNLLYAEPGASEGDLWEVLRLTNLAGFVEGLPKGLDTEVGDGGVLLSGGERQRVAIARTLLLRPRVLLLDEVTSQLDARNERALRDTIYRVSKERAVVAIAHRLSTVVDAGRIVVLEAGRVRAVGTHAELLERDDLYRDLVTTQLLDADPRGRDGKVLSGERPRTGGAADDR